MADTFVSFDRYLRAQETPPQIERERASVSDDVAEAQIAGLREVRLFRACLADALDALRESLLRDLAATVLARELQIAPAEIESIAAQALERLVEDEPVRLLACSADLPALAAIPLPVRADARLRRGDLLVEVRFGTIDVSLGVRLAQVLEAFA